MKTTIFTTGETFDLAQKQVFQAPFMERPVKITLTDETVSEDFLGFGVALTGSSCYLLNEMEPDRREAFLRSIYTSDGLGLSVARLTIGSSDYSAELYSYDDVENDVDLSRFSIERDKAYVIPMIREILKINPDLYLFASPWSPPAWMKTGGSLCGGYMREEYVECYANYIVKYLKAYEACGIRIRTVTPQNEPETHQGGRMPACRWHPDTEARFIGILRKKLSEAGLDVEIWMHDHNFSGTQRIRWSLNHHPGLSSDCNGIAFHYYEGAIEDTLPLQNEFPYLRMHFTEGGPRLYDNYGTDWCKWGIMMSKALNCGYRSFTGWNLMLDETGNPNIGPFFCGGLVTKNSLDGALSYSGQYKALRHFSGFRTPGMKILKTELSPTGVPMAAYPKPADALQVTALKHPDGTVILHLINPDKNKLQVQIRDRTQLWYTELLPNTLNTVKIEP